MLVFFLQWLSLHWKILVMLLHQFPLTFHHIHNGIPIFTALLISFLMLIATVFMIIWEMFYESISLNSVLLLLLANFVSGFRLELMYISLIESIRSSLIHLHGFQLLVLKIEIYRNHFFCLCQKDKFSESKVKFRQASNRFKRVLEAAKLAYVNKTNQYIISQ